jgi:aminoglycoside phosphotransferase (APT) family kinase protein
MRGYVLEHLLKGDPAPWDKAHALVNNEPRAWAMMNRVAGEALARSRPTYETDMRLVHQVAINAAALMLATIYDGDSELKGLREQVFQLQERMLSMHRLTPPPLNFQPEPGGPPAAEGRSNLDAQ